MNLRLGPYDPSLPPLITPLGIPVHANGLNDYGPKRIRKTCQRMIEAGVEEWLIVQFRDWALRLPQELANWIDLAYVTRLTDWNKCVGCKLPNGKAISATIIDTIRPTTFRIVLHPEPFAVAQGVLTAGASWSDRVEVVMAYLDQGNWLRKCDDLVAWELGNLIGIRHGFSPRVVTEEVGNKSPCS